MADDNPTVPPPREFSRSRMSDDPDQYRKPTMIPTRQELRRMEDRGLAQGRGPLEPHKRPATMSQTRRNLKSYR